MENFNNENIGIVKISDEVVSVIAGIAAEEIDGVMEFQHGVTNNISQLLKGKKSSGKSVKVTLEEDRAKIEMAVTVEYGVKILDVIGAVQENVKNTVEAMTGLIVSSVDIYVQNIYLPKTQEKESKEM
ncbi:Asp23/Gls24 family envelope stress response protein [Clostridium sp.]|uniref:Asp23/Gls24 family envelope stress response protein n=1 Tax=Clostridium sp. TaxID=1506 RepID=UPI002A90B68A|nr:Asp23/Gls24 family envelope stress response protein [Clostridium sp.]MDY6011798.1 Asp23/Gls24 family envelope stress response protein [Clostridium sp.]